VANATAVSMDENIFSEVKSVHDDDFACVESVRASKVQNDYILTD
jgi:hypothetical protein